MNAWAHAVPSGSHRGRIFAPSFRFYSPSGGVEASGCFATLATPAEEDGQALERSVQQALGEARAAGLGNPAVVGVIPFDKWQPSQLFVPRHLAFLPPASPPTSICGLPCGAARSCIEQPGRDGFRQAVNQALDLLRAGRIDKAVLSRLLQLEFDEPPCAQTIFQGLRQQNPEAYHFAVELPDDGVLIGASPELLLRKRGRAFASNPLAGSARRSDDPLADEWAARGLLDSAKDQHEHRLVIEELAGQLRPLCRSLSVPLAPTLLKTARLWHLSTQIEGELEDELSALRLACRLHPTPALCGFPTAAAKQVIAELEPFDRGVFGGIVGWCDAAGNGEWAVVIRCGIIQQTRVRLFAGAGLVSASCPEAEWHETGTKLGTMLAAFGLDKEAV
ncbi:isochorismate synthase [Pseudomonas stutzeri]|uniref:isochorismate synthase n=1 Tax=Stutzerimonas stutzeri TaxID=316 RepID=UPI0015E0F36F|nr:isochorismate synthase [Stutzerimonas stutzeri]MCQ4326299.1 isochorismate synthase [Stutzerimonas stutzeri]